MKKVYLLSMIGLMAIFSSCGSVPLVAEQSHEKIVRTTASKNELFVKANEWMVQNFYDQNSVIQFSDRENGALAAKRLVKSFYLDEESKKYWQKQKQKGKHYFEDVYLTFRIKVKDNAAKLVISNPKYYWFNAKGFRYSEETLKADINSFLNSFTKFMSNSQILDDDF